MIRKATISLITENLYEVARLKGIKYDDFSKVVNALFKHTIQIEQPFKDLCIFMDYKKLESECNEMEKKKKNSCDNCGKMSLYAEVANDWGVGERYVQLVVYKYNVLERRNARP